MKKVNYINIILRVNQISYGATGILFITFFFGLMAELYLGALQIISSLLILFFWKHLSNGLKKGTYYYWIAVIVYLVGFYLVFELKLFSDFVGMGIIGLVIIPMLIGLYLLLHLNSIKKSFVS